VADGRVTREERGEPHAAIETVLPPEARRRSRLARAHSFHSGLAGDQPLTAEIQEFVSRMLHHAAR
jgi:hypothetical protein